MKYNPDIHHRKSIRLKGYDYSQEGAYFVTICTQNRECMLGEIKNGKMILNDGGVIVKKYWNEIPKHYPIVILDEFVVMPNHVHGIIIINRDNVGVNDYSPKNINANDYSPKNVGANDYSPKNITANDNLSRSIRANDNSPLQINGTSNSLGAIVRGFKIGVTKWFRTNSGIIIVWQKNYYEHIIRNEKSLNAIREYIINNPDNWEKDEMYVS